ncbi:MAG: hypothetical protein IJ011_00965 [Clostridia bacterium]|nr:hypothetical protein [Clostridia bacterium]
MKNKNEKKKKFKLFDLNRDGKGVYEEENRKPNLKFFFVLLWRKLTQLLQLNLLMLFQVLPILGIVLINIFGAKTFNTSSALYAPLYGISKIVDSPALFNKLDLIGNQIEAPLVTPLMLLGMAVLAIFLFITFGWQNVGAAYVLRGLFRGDPVFVFSDYFYGIKKNWKQGLIVGMIDFVCCAVLIIDIYFFMTSASSLGIDIMLGIMVAVAIIYIFMRFYIYQLLITFDMKIIKMIKNSLIFSILGIFRNLMGLIGIVLLLALHVILIIWLLPMGITIPLILPFVYIVAIIGFISVYAAYPVIDKYMIAPYESEKNAEADSDEHSADVE